MVPSGMLLVGTNHKTFANGPLRHSSLYILLNLQPVYSIPLALFGRLLCLLLLPPRAEPLMSPRAGTFVPSISSWIDINASYLNGSGVSFADWFRFTVLLDFSLMVINVPRHKK